MYEIALSVAACVRSGTRVDVAWLVADEPSEEGLAFTPGGGRVGEVATGAFDGFLSDAAARQLPGGRLIQHSVTDVEAALSGIAAGTSVRFVMAPGTLFPPDLWQRLMAREPVVLEVLVDGDELVSLAYPSTGAPRPADDQSRLLAHFQPVPRLVVAGQGPIAEALANQGALLGWKVQIAARPEVVAGFAATLASTDAVVVMGHDVESSGGCLMAALQSEAGYVGAVGSRAMQQARADWLAYRDITDLERVHGPAGLDIGAGSPAEVAVAIAAEIIAAQAGRA